MVGPHGGGRDLRAGVCHTADLDRGAGFVLPGPQLQDPQTAVRLEISLRITSYNVCYTKLLRMATDLIPRSWES